MIDIQKIFNINSDKEFNLLALQIFNYQFNNNIVYNKYIKYLGVNVSKIKTIEQIPFLPIDFFKYHKVISSNNKTEKIFKSSGTTLDVRSNHYISDLQLYEQSFNTGFKNVYGNIKDYCILGLLPSYIENEDSSLVYMVEELIKQSGKAESGLYLNNYKELSDLIKNLENINQKYIIIGVSYALLDFAEQVDFKLNNAIIIETGGMKGRRKELPKEELHRILINGFGVKNINSEYGMTELLSQAYSTENGIFKPPCWMKILIRDIYDPFTYLQKGKSGGINIIDLANINSCSFIETKDLGRLNPDNYFSIIGRFDNSDIRGCNLLLE